MASEQRQARKSQLKSTKKRLTMTMRNPYDDDDLRDLYDVAQHPESSRARKSRLGLPRLASRFSNESGDAENLSQRLSGRLVPFSICLLSLVLLLSVDFLSSRANDVRRLMLNITYNEAKVDTALNRGVEMDADQRVDSTVVAEEGDRNVLSITETTDGSQHTEIQTTEIQKVFSFHIRRQETIPIEEQVFLDVWKKRWNQAGFSAHVLYIEDAMRHPEFANFSSIIDSLIAISTMKRDPELRYCYYRYLAMAAAGGGMMVDIDTRPAVNATNNETLPTTFTLYCATGREHRHGSQDWLLQTESQSGIPCAASGSPEAWLKIAEHLHWALEQNKDKRKWTDMNGLAYLQQFGEVDLVKERKVTTWKARAFDKCSFRTV